MDDRQIALIIQESVVKEVKKFIKNSDLAMVKGATVVTGGANNANVVILFAGDTTNTPNVPNRTGITLNTGDKIDVLIKNLDYSNCFVAWKR